MKTILYVLVAAVIVLGGYWYFSQGNSGVGTENLNNGVAGVAASQPSAPEPVIKEFTMTAFADATGPKYSLSEMTVNKGDTIVIKATNTKGMHDFSIDEYGIKRELPLNEEQVIGFVADKAGDYIYYCSKMDHRAKGQWGVLHVLP